MDIVIDSYYNSQCLIAFFVWIEFSIRFTIEKIKEEKVGI